MKNYNVPEDDQLLHDLAEYTDLFQIRANRECDIWEQIIKDIEEYNDLMDHVSFLDEIPLPPMEKFESPDVVYAKNNSDFVMGIECFMFDASRKTSKGSTQIRREYDAERQIIEAYRNGDKIKKDGCEYVAVRKLVDVKYSPEHYYKTLFDTFVHHAKNLHQYRKNLEDKYPGKKVYLAFFIDDVTAVGNYVTVEGKTECLTPLKLPFFIRILLTTKELDYVLVKTTDMYVPSIEIQSCSVTNLNRLLESCYPDDAKYVTYQYAFDSHFY